MSVFNLLGPMVCIFELPLERNAGVLTPNPVGDKKPDGGLFNTTLGVLKWHLLAAAFPRLCFLGFSFAQPFLINRAILFASSPDAPENRNVGYGLIGAYVLVYVGLAVRLSVTEYK